MTVSKIGNSFVGGWKTLHTTVHLQASILAFGEDGQDPSRGRYLEVSRAKP